MDGPSSFRRGSIRRVRMKNFLTYDDCEVFPGPKLNAVVGPNGSGKSSITHAICLACCGSADDIGRTSDLSKFVKHGTSTNDESYVEVDLVDSGDKVVTIRRILNTSNNRSSWLLDKKSAKLDTVKQFVYSLSIDVDNLCSFMPQDRVGAFSQYNGKEMLQNTLKAIRETPDKHAASASSNLFDDQGQLSSMEAEKERLRRDKDAIARKHDDVKRQLDSLQGEVNRMKRKDEAIFRQRLLTVKLLFLQCQELKNLADAKEAELHIAVAMTAEIDGRVAILQKELKRLQAAKQRLLTVQSSSTASSNTEILSGPQAVSRLLHIKESLSTSDEEIENNIYDMNGLVQKRQRIEAKVHDADREIAHLQDKVRESEAAQVAAQSALQDAMQRMRTAKEQSVALDEQLSALQSDMGQKNTRITQCTRQLEGLKDSKQLFRQKLQERRDPVCDDAVRAMDWLDRHLPQLRESGQLRGKVVGPVGMECCVENPVCAAAFEKVVTFNKLLGFLVENTQDAKTLNRVFREELRLKLDIYTIHEYSVLTARLPYSKEQVESFAAFGVQGYLSDQLQCSDMVRAFLYSFAKIHHVLWGSSASEIESRHFGALCPQGAGSTFCLFMQYSDERIMEYSGRRSRFAPQNAPSTASVRVGAPKGLLSGDRAGKASLQQRRMELERDMDVARKELDELSNTVASRNADKQRLETELGVLRKLKDDALARQNEPAHLRRRLQAQEKSRDALQRQLAADLESERSRRQLQLIEQTNRILDEMRGGFECLDRGFEALCLKSARALKRQAVDSRLESVAAQCDEARGEAQQQRLRADALRRAIEQANAAFREKESRLEDVVHSVGAEEFHRDVFPKAMTETPAEPAVVEQQLLEVSAEIDAIVDNPGLIQKAAALQAELEQCQLRVQSSAAAADNVEESLRLRKEQWLKEVRALTNKLDSLFQKYMAELRFGGEVHLREQGSFMDYELCLMVKFRAEAPLSQLSAQKHSGGERAVSTIMFLMALQDLTPAPFRVVDEINQGMDERNERLVVDRVVRSCCGPAAQRWRPQYFLVTPKLLPALISLAHEDVTVLCVRSGCGLLAPQWTFAEVLRSFALKRTSRELTAPSTTVDEWDDTGSSRSGAGQGAEPESSKRRRVAVKQEAKSKQMEVVDLT